MFTTSKDKNGCNHLAGNAELAGAIHTTVATELVQAGEMTVFGTAGCIAVSVATNYLVFYDLAPDVLYRVILSAALVPVLLAGPLFFYLSLKLRELAIVNRKLAELASTDNLTECLNRGAFTAIVDELIAGRRTDGASAQGALLVLDVDHFKHINDRHGHDQGDQALKILVQAIRSALRKNDFLGRLGGEEFGIFLPDASAGDSAEVAERIRHSVFQADFAPGGTRHPLSVSLGGAAFRNRTSFTELFRIADERLYAAKAEGRNRVKLARLPQSGQSLALAY